MAYSLFDARMDTENRYDASFVIIGSIKGCHNDNLWWHRWQQVTGGIGDCCNNSGATSDK